MSHRRLTGVVTAAVLEVPDSGDSTRAAAVIDCLEELGWTVA